MTANRSYCASQKQPASPSGMLKFPIPCLPTTACLRMPKKKKKKKTQEKGENQKKHGSTPLDGRAERAFSAAGFPGISDAPKQRSPAMRRCGLSAAAFRGTKSARCGEREPRGHPELRELLARSPRTCATPRLHAHLCKPPAPGRTRSLAFPARPP